MGKIRQNISGCEAADLVPLVFRFCGWFCQWEIFHLGNLWGIVFLGSSANPTFEVGHANLDADQFSLVMLAKKKRKLSYIIQVHLSMKTILPGISQDPAHGPRTSGYFKDFSPSSASTWEYPRGIKRGQLGNPLKLWVSNGFNRKITYKSCVCSIALPFSGDPPSSRTSRSVWCQQILGTHGSNWYKSMNQINPYLDYL